MKKVEDWYPITTRVTPEGDEQVFITHEDLKDYTPPKDWDSLTNYLMGSTRYLQGYYLTDVEGWLNNRRNLD